MKRLSFMKQIEIYDTTLRDGAQTEGISLSLEDKLKIALRLDKFGVHFIEGGWPGSNVKDAEFFKEIKKHDLKNAEIVAFGSTRRANTKPAQDDNLKALVDSKMGVVTIFGKSWDFHVTEVFKTTLKENLAMIRDSVSFLKSKKMKVIYDAEHFFDGFKKNPEYALASIQEAEKAGADRIVLCDTNGGSIPQAVAEAVKQACATVKTPIGIHCHNDCELAAANSIAAVQNGAIHVQGTINGYGERTGNANLVSIIPILQLKLGYKVVPKQNLKTLTELSRFVAEICNMPILTNQPFVGRSCFAHKAGVHVNAMVKNSQTYEHLDPQEVGNERRFLISELSGKTNVLLKSREMNLGLDKDSPQTKTILSKITELENQGYQFEAAEASLELLMKKILGKYKPYFEFCGFRVVDEVQADHTNISRASVDVKVGGREEHSEAQGDGPVNALDQALRKALAKFYPVLQNIHLTDYKVRVINSEAGTAAKVRVFIQFSDEKNRWSTVGVSENVIEASWLALVDAIEYKLMRG